MTISEMTIQEKLGALYATLDCSNRPCTNCAMCDICPTINTNEFRRKLIIKIQKELREKEQTNDQEN